MPIETIRKFSSEQVFPSNGLLGDKDVQLLLHRNLSISFAAGDEVEVLEWLQNVTREFAQSIERKVL